MVESRLIPKKYQTTTGVLRWIKVLVIFAFCSFAWIFFVAHSISDAMYVIHHLTDGIRNPVTYINNGFAKLGIGLYDKVFLAIPVFVLLLFDYHSLNDDVIEKISSYKMPIRWIIYVALVLSVMMNFTIDKPNEFIYFQF